MEEKVKIFEGDNETDNLMPVSLDMIRPNCPFTFSLYIKINDRFVLYVKKGDDIEEEKAEKFQQIIKLKEKDVERLYVLKVEVEELATYVEEEIEQAVNEPNIEPDERFQRIQEIASTAIECSFNDPEAQEAFDLCEKAAKGLRKVVTSNPKALKKIFHRRGRSTDIIQQHCNNVAALAVKLAFTCGVRGDELDDLGAAAYLHDIGHGQMTQDDIDILFKRPTQMLKGDDRRIYQTHIEQAERVLAKKDYVNNRIIEFIKKHEEQLDGKGYPDRVNILRPSEQILALVNKYDKIVTVLGKSPTEAYIELQQNCIGLYDLKYIKKLKEMLLSEGIIG